MSNPIPLTDPLAVEWLQWCADEGTPPATIARRKAALRGPCPRTRLTRHDRHLRGNLR
jgi:hypothetical protein